MSATRDLLPNRPEIRHEPNRATIETGGMLRQGTRQLRKGRHSEANRIYLLTSVTRRREPVFADYRLGRLLVHVLMHEQSTGELRSLAFVVMPDHLHWLVELGPGGDLSRSMGRIKAVSAKRVNAARRRPGRVWQAGFHDHALRKDEDLVHTARYVIANPLRAGLVRSVREYPLWDAIWV